MTLDFQQIQQQVRELGENAARRKEQVATRRQQARAILEANADNLEGLRQKVQRVVAQYETTLRCALPVDEALNAHFPLPALPAAVTIVAADGSQITPDRHGEVEYGLINVGSICMQPGAGQAPATQVISRLLYDEALENLSEAALALQRDLYERKQLAEAAKSLPTPAVTFTDGPMELWGGGAHEAGEASEFKKRMEEYRQVLRALQRLGAVTAGYVDKPAARTMVRLLEVALTAEDELPEIKQRRPLRPVRDSDLFREMLGPGERSAVFGIQSPNMREYPDELELHFFYLNVRRQGRPWIARVEAPAWVVENPSMLDTLHAVLIEQCRIMGNRPYPYVLHRAHETAVVTLPEKDQVTQMIALELRRRGGELEGSSQKQEVKDLGGRKAYGKGGQARR